MENDNNDKTNNDKTNDRYFTNQEEFQILSESIGIYINLPKRSQDRKSFITKIRKKLEKIKPNQWDDKKVRVWFTNNEKRFKKNNNDVEPENDNQFQPESPQVPLQQITYIDNGKTMLNTQFMKPSIQQVQSRYEQPQPQQPIQQSQYELQPSPIQQHIQLRYEQPPQPFQQPPIDQQQPPIQQQIHPQQHQQQHPIQKIPIQQQIQPQYEPQPLIQPPQYDHQQTPIQPQYEQQPQQHPIQPPQYEQQQTPIQPPQYEQQQTPIQLPQYEQPQTPIQPQYAQQLQQQPIHPQYEQQLQPIQPQYDQQQQQYQQPQQIDQQQQQTQQYQQPSQYQQQQQNDQQQQPPQYQQQPSEMYREQSETQGIQNFPGAEMSQSQFYCPYNTLSTPLNSSNNSFWQVNSSFLATSSATNESKSTEPAPEPEPEPEETGGEENADDLPLVPEVGDELSEQQKDELKYKLYNVLRDCYKYFKRINNYKSPDIRLSKQKELEDVFIKILKLFPDKLGIDVIFSKDTTSLCITSKNLSVSITTQRYNNLPVDTDAPNNVPHLVKGNPFIYYSNTFIPARLSPLIRSFYFGKYEEGCRSVIDISNIEVATFNEESGDSICTVFNQSLSSHQIIIGQNDAEAPTGFFGKANAMIVHNNNVYIQGDVRVKVFNLNSLECIDTLFIKDGDIKKSAISIWNENIAVGVDNTIYLYSENTPMSCREDAAFKKKYESVSIEMKIDKNSIDWTNGRKHKRPINVENIKSISSMVTVDKQYLVVASEDYPVIYVYGQKESIIARLIGHTMGITSLYASDVDTFYSGSKDRTVKKWNIKDSISTHSFIMNGNDVTSITTATYNDHLFLFSGSKDSKILVWDVSAKKSTFQIDLTDKLYPTELLFIPNSSTLYIIAQQKDKQGNQINSDDQIQMFTFSK